MFFTSPGLLGYILERDNGFLSSKSGLSLMWRCYGSLEVSLSSEGGWNLRKKMWLVKAKLQKELGANLMRKGAS